MQKEHQNPLSLPLFFGYFSDQVTNQRAALFCSKVVNVNALLLSQTKSASLI